ncbi:hypothetical protein DPMN_173731 [Dreissena polymorpha]|uniref:Uncharacterized protein n=1 Tax=Dreissena polymorpha TaxID=45954 RepID=A0A9D4E563_DREPO|nr:hypothetical protein DPMN_173731 [Dreissena polymorpha]
MVYPVDAYECTVVNQTFLFTGNKKGGVAMKVSCMGYAYDLHMAVVCLSEAEKGKGFTPRRTHRCPTNATPAKQTTISLPVPSLPSPKQPTQAILHPLSRSLRQQVVSCFKSPPKAAVAHSHPLSIKHPGQEPSRIAANKRPES